MRRGGNGWSGVESLLVLAGIAVLLAIAGCGDDDDSQTGGETLAASCSAGPCDLVIVDGRVVDPLTSTDRTAAVGIQDGRIDVIESSPEAVSDLVASAARVIDADGLVVAPGFINIHGHEADVEGTTMVSVRDGITTYIGGNCGSLPWLGDPVPAQDFFASVEAAGLYTNYAAYTGHNTLRLRSGVPDAMTPATQEQIAQMVEMAAQDLAAGALGVSYGPFYHPGAAYEEMIALAVKSAELGGGDAIHVRYALPLPDPGLPVAALNEGIQLATESGVPLLISHEGGPLLGAGSAGTGAEFIFRGLEEGVNLGSDMISGWPFGVTSILAPVFLEPPYVPWMIDELIEMLGNPITDWAVVKSVIIDGAVYMQAGEHFDSLEEFRYVRDTVFAGAAEDPNVTYGYVFKEYWYALWLSLPFVMVETDSYVARDPATGEYVAAPWVAGNFAHFWGYWIREGQLCNLSTAVYKTSTLAALWLGLDKKGRVQVGCDADLVLFDPDTIMDANLLANPVSLEPPVGIPYVIVNGELVVDQGELSGSKPGQMIRRTWTVPGQMPGPWQQQQD
ncbi:MAG: amidohydrolase family protein [bacterium]